MPSPHFYMIPGSGTDRRMYAPQFEAFPPLAVPEWLPPLSRKEPLQSYSQRLAQTIDTSVPFVLGGVSLGGMIAQEMAKHVKPTALLLISTCSTSKAIPLYWRLKGRLTRMLPDKAVDYIMRSLARATRKMPEKKIPQKETLARMLEEMPPSLVRWQTGISTEWALGAAPKLPILRIHGARDKIIPLRNVIADVVIPDGGHLINITHAARVNELIAAFVATYAIERI